MMLTIFATITLFRILHTPMKGHQPAAIHPMTQDMGYGSGYVRSRPRLRRNIPPVTIAKVLSSSGQSAYWSSEAAGPVTRCTAPPPGKAARGKEMTSIAAAQSANNLSDDGMMFGRTLNVVTISANIATGSPALYAPPQSALDDIVNMELGLTLLTVEVEAT
jgi:hypothetical protein